MTGGGEVGCLRGNGVTEKVWSSKMNRVLYVKEKDKCTISKAAKEMLSYLAAKLLHFILERPFVVNSKGEYGAVTRFNIKPFVHTYELPSISRSWRTPAKLTLKFNTRA